MRTLHTPFPLRSHSLRSTGTRSGNPIRGRRDASHDRKTAPAQITHIKGLLLTAEAHGSPFPYVAPRRQGLLGPRLRAREVRRVSPVRARGYWSGLADKGLVPATLASNSPSCAPRTTLTRTQLLKIRRRIFCLGGMRIQLSSRVTKSCAKLRMTRPSQKLA